MTEGNFLYKQTLIYRTPAWFGPFLSMNLIQASSGLSLVETRSTSIIT